MRARTCASAYALRVRPGQERARSTRARGFLDGARTTTALPLYNRHHPHLLSLYNRRHPHLRVNSTPARSTATSELDSPKTTPLEPDLS